jgi:ATP-binding cassette subfamily B protein
VRGVSMNYFAHGVMYAIRVDAYEKMQRLDMTFFDNKETGEVMSILNNDTGNLEVFFDNALGDAVRIGVIVGGVTAALLYTNWQLALVTLGVIPLLVGFTWWFVRIIEPRYTRHRSVIGDLNTRIENGLSGIELVKSMNTEDYENERVRSVSRDVFDAQMDVLKRSYFYRPGMELVTGTALLATFVIGGLWVFSGRRCSFRAHRRRVRRVHASHTAVDGADGAAIEHRRLVRERPRVGQAHLRADGRARPHRGRAEPRSP